jgi:hypothetical protein
MYYDSTLHTPRYKDQTAVWSNFISEYGSVTIPPTNSVWRVNFRKPYGSPPLVIATPEGNTEDMVFVRNYNLTATYVDFQISIMTGGGNFYDNSTHPQDVNYIVIPQ